MWAQQAYDARARACPQTRWVSWANRARSHTRASRTRSFTRASANAHVHRSTLALALLHAPSCTRSLARERSHAHAPTLARARSNSPTRTLQRSHAHARTRVRCHFLTQTSPCLGGLIYLEACSSLSFLARQTRFSVTRDLP
eukprot:5802350-Pleurochrysis_carterae.AAC.2